MALRSMLAMGYPVQNEQVWVPPIIRTIATDGDGVEEVIKALQEHKDFLHSNGVWQKRDQIRIQTFVRKLLERKRGEEWQQFLQKQDVQDIFTRIFDRKLSPFRAVEQLQSDSFLKNLQ